MQTERSKLNVIKGTETYNLKKKLHKENITFIRFWYVFLPVLT